MAEGVLALIESVGSKGVLVAFGGFSKEATKAMNVTDDQLLNPSLHRILSIISIYDIDSQTWFQQTATGDILRWRYIRCSVAVSAPDQSSIQSMSMLGRVALLKERMVMFTSSLYRPFDGSA